MSIPENVSSCSKREQKSSIHRYLDRKVDDSLPDFAAFVVRGFWKCGKRAQKGGRRVDNLCGSHKKTRRSGFFANCCLPKQKPINAWRTVDDDVLYADRLSYVQPDEHHE
ncbi:hypothetical protein EXN74_05635 [Leclercia adecarboxylata]|nr:hypothetical protein EXN74_05635 [Leclercia adecarboxylata]QFH51689.1 hypothetical protein FR819_21460 [Leclercia adecarboxylata]